MSEDGSGSPRIKLAVRWAAVIAAFAIGGVFVLGAGLSMILDPNLYRIAISQFPATVGLPFAALAAFCLVIVLESSNGPIRVKGLGFEFAGAGGPILMWICCFWAIAGAIKLLWASS